MKRKYSSDMRRSTQGSGAIESIRARGRLLLTDRAIGLQVTRLLSGIDRTDRKAFTLGR